MDLQIALDHRAQVEQFRHKYRTGLVTLLFTDIVGSTKLKQALGDRDAVALMHHHHALVREILSQFPDGQEISTAGDSFFLVFVKPSDAVRFALLLQSRLRGLNQGSSHPVLDRIGIHIGEVVIEEREGAAKPRDLYGMQVDSCARVMSLAAGNQILLTRSAFDNARQALKGEEMAGLGALSWLNHGTYQLAGVEEPVEICEVGEANLAALKQPPDSEKARRAVVGDQETVLGWRPASGQLVPITIHPNNLPVQLTSFIGRERETDEVTRLIGGDSDSQPSGIRLLTLTGPGGIGKTRLAVQVAASLLERFPDGVWLVELAALSDPSLVPQTVASAIGLLNMDGRPPLELLTRYLAPKQTLLLLDNCEHLVAACADLTDALLRVCPRLQILATSREGLRLAGETLWPVPSLSVPSLAGGQLGNGTPGTLGQYESVKLFVERARAVTPAFELNEQNGAAVAQLCHRLDGIPLAIELAAARTRLLPVEQLLERVQDRFRLLTGGSRTALPRQQTLRALVDWSYDLLSDQERLLFDRLSVFAGGWTLAAAETVCADDGGGRKIGGRGPTDFLRSEDILDLLGHLLEKSMVLVERSADGTARYRLLETLRQYGQERLATGGEAAANALRTRHTTYFIALAEQVALGMYGPDQPKLSDRLALEHDNLRAALEWGKAGDAPPDRVELVLRLAAPLYLPWLRQGHGREGRQHFETLLSHRNAQRPTRARAQVLFAVGSFALWQDGDDATAWALLNKSLSLAEQLGDTRAMADARHNLGVVLSNRGDKAGARRHHEEALRLTRADGDVSGIRWALEDLGDLAADEGDAVHASELLAEALSLARQTGDQHGIGSILHSMGDLARAAGKAERAKELIGEGLSIVQRIGCQHCSARYLGDLAFVASASGEPERAVRLLGAADALRERTGIVIRTTQVETIEQTLGEARRRLGEAAYAAVWSEGRAMSLPQATAYALRPSAPALSS